MTYGIREKCGVIGIHLPDVGQNVSISVFEGLYALQHRGQESCGIYVCNDSSIAGQRAMGTVEEAFTQGKLLALLGNVGIGHVRYSTTAKSTIAEAQPFYYESPSGAFAVAFNGTVANFLELRKRMESSGHSFVTQTDTEVLVHLIADGLRECGDYSETLKRCLQSIDGSCSLVLLNDKGELYALRDPLGFKPLGLGTTKEGAVIVASESAAIDALDGTFEGDVRPGEILKVDAKGIQRQQAFESPRRAFCMFEYVYFSRPDSVLQSKTVYEVRYQLGRNLAKEHPADVDIVVPVPDSGKTAALGYADELGKPYVEGLIKNRYIWRTFIMPSQDARELSVKLKLNPVRALIQGRAVALIDDSIVRGTTMRRIVRLLKHAGARSVHVRISCPPITSSCYMGIDFPTKGELMASYMSVDEIRTFIEADSLGYQSLKGLVESIGLPKEELCMACLTGEYPLSKKPDFVAMEAALGVRA